MKFVLASYGTRGDVEPYIAVGRELLHRGHEVRMAVPPDQVGFAESAGLAAVGYGPDARRWQQVHREFLARLPRGLRHPRELARCGREDWALINQFWTEAVTTMMSLADGADLLFTGVLGEEPAANIAEYYDIPFATMHYFPLRPNSQLVPTALAPLGRAAMAMSEWLMWPVSKKLEDAQRRELGLDKARRPPPRRIAERGSLEIQAYDEVCVPGLAAEWAAHAHRRPFVGALTLELATEADTEVAAWMAAGTPPIFFGFGSMPVESAADTFAMIAAVSAELGERALVCSAGSDFSHLRGFEHVKVVETMNYADAFPRCRAVVHHGGVGTTAAGLRAGVPSVLLWTWADQKLWAKQVQRLEVGRARQFSATTAESLLEDLRAVLSPQCVSRARELATRVTTSSASVASAADVLEVFADRRRVG